MQIFQELNTASLRQSHPILQPAHDELSRRILPPGLAIRSMRGRAPAITAHRIPGRAVVQHAVLDGGWECLERSAGVRIAEHDQGLDLGDDGRVEPAVGEDAMHYHAALGVANQGECGAGAGGGLGFEAGDDVRDADGDG